MIVARRTPRSSSIIPVSLAILMLIPLESGCYTVLVGLDKATTRNREVTREGTWGDFELGAVYQLLTDSFLDKSRPSGHPHLHLVPPWPPAKREGYSYGPPSVEAYRREPKRWRRVAGVVEAGTRIRCEFLNERTSRISVDSRSLVFRILDGPHTESTVVLWRLRAGDLQRVEEE